MRNICASSNTRSLHWCEHEHVYKCDSPCRNALRPRTAESLQLLLGRPFVGIGCHLGNLHKEAPHALLVCHDQGEATTPKKEARRVPPSALDLMKALESSVLKHNTKYITPNLARRPPQEPCRTSGDDPPAPVGIVWCVAAVSAWISTISI